MVPGLVVRLGVCDRVSLRRLECRSASLVMEGVEFWLVVRFWGQVLSPPTGGFASVNIKSSVLCPSVPLRAALSASSWCGTPVCDFTLPICVRYPMLSLVCMIPSVSRKRSLCGWWVKLSGSMAYLRMVLMLNALSIRIERIWLNLLASSARIIASNSARLIVCLSG